MSIKPLLFQNEHVGECCFSQQKTFMVKFHFSETVKLDSLMLAED